MRGMRRAKRAGSAALLSLLLIAPAAAQSDMTIRVAYIPFEASAQVVALGDAIGQDLHRDLAVQPRVASAIYLAHAAGAQLRFNLVRAKSRASAQSHAWARL